MQGRTERQRADATNAPSSVAVAIRCQASDLELVAIVLDGLVESMPRTIKKRGLSAAL